METKTPNPSDFIFNLTVESFTALLKAVLTEILSPYKSSLAEEDVPLFDGLILYSTKQIEDYFHVSHKRACQMIAPGGVLEKSTVRNGRKLMVDVNHAMRALQRANAEAAKANEGGESDE